MRKILGVAERKMESYVQTRVYISSTMDVKSRVSNWWKKLRLKTAMQHIGLLVILAGYTVAGGWVSYGEINSLINKIKSKYILKKNKLLAF